MLSSATALSCLLLALSGAVSGIPMPQGTAAPSQTTAAPVISYQQLQGPFSDQVSAFASASRLAAAINQTADLAVPSFSTISAIPVTTTQSDGATVSRTGAYGDWICPTGMVRILFGEVPACCPGLYYDGECHRTDTAPLPSYTMGLQPAQLGSQQVFNANANAGRGPASSSYPMLVATTVCASLILGAFLL